MLSTLKPFLCLTLAPTDDQLLLKISIHYPGESLWEYSNLPGRSCYLDLLANCHNLFTKKNYSNRRGELTIRSWEWKGYTGEHAPLKRRSEPKSGSTLTFSASSLSNFLTITWTVTEHNKTTAIATITAIFPVSDNCWNSTRTLSKSLGFCSTKRLLPNNVKWLQLQFKNPSNAAKTWNYKLQGRC